MSSDGLAHRKSHTGKVLGVRGGIQSSAKENAKIVFDVSEKELRQLIKVSLSTVIAEVLRHNYESTINNKLQAKLVLCLMGIRNTKYETDNGCKTRKQQWQLM